MILRNGARRMYSSAAAPSDVVIVSAARTPIGSFNGSLSRMSCTELGSVAVAAAIERAGISGADVGEVYLGNVLPANAGQAPSRQIALGAGIPTSVPTTDVNKVCASGMKTIMFAAQSIQLGYEDIVVAGGYESMSNIPMYVPKGVPAYGHGQMLDGLLRDGLTDVYNDVHMGMCGEKCSTDYGISRAEQDHFALRSYELAQKSVAEGLFAPEIVPVPVPQGRGREPKIFAEDEEPKNFRGADKLASVRPAFTKDGTITAANASKLNDGACAVVVMSRAKAEALGAPILASILGFADGARDPMDFTTAPALTVPKAIERAGLSMADVDLHEINEAFAVVALANAKLLEIPIEKVNVRGGAIAIGHPIGCSGARIVATLAHTLRDTIGPGAIGCASICNGGGGASAMVIRSE